MQRILIIFLFIHFAAAPIRSQLTIHSNLQQYTTENGLPSNGIKGLQWDEETGFLWIATEAGIVRFNGVDFRSYTKANTPGIGSERMLFMTRNHAGNIYISDLTGNIFHITQNLPAFWRQGRGVSNPYFENYYLLPVSDTFFSKYAGIIKSNIFSAVTDKILSLSDTSCLILHQGTLFYQEINTEKPISLSFENRNVETIFKIGTNTFISNNRSQFFLFNSRNQKTTPVSFSDESGLLQKTEIIKDQLFWEQGMQYPILIIGENAWQLSFYENKIIAKLIFKGVPPDAYIKAVQYSEKNNTLFIGTDSKGLIVINQNRVESKKRVNENPKNRNSYYAQIELSNGNILTNEGDIIGNNPQKNFTLPIKKKFTYNVSITNDSLIWYVQTSTQFGYNCLHSYNKSTGQTKIYDEIKTECAITTSGSNIYLTNQAGIYKLETDSFRIIYKHSKEFTGNQVYDFREIEPGVFAIATCAGILRYTITTSRLDTILKKQSGCVRSILRYKDYVFFGTYGSGYFLYKRGQIKSMPLDKNRYLLYAHCFVPDDNGFCWISSNRGLFKASMEELIHAFENNSSTVYYHYLGKKDGMEMTELNGGCTPCALRLKNKIISFPTMDGLLWVNPETANIVLPEGNIYIDQVLADNKTIDPGLFSKKELPAKTSEIIINLAYTAWCNKENIYIEYRLNDMLNWKTVTLNNESEIRLNNLPSGKYTLRIRKLNGFGLNNYSYTEIRFAISTPWYHQWWFYILSAAVVLTLLTLFFNYRTRQFTLRQHRLEKQVAEKTKELLEKNEVLEKHNSIKTRLISIISHDIVTPLKFLTVAGKNLVEKRKLMPEELQQETIEEITNTSQELQLLSTNILNWIKYQNENRRLVKEVFNVHEMVAQVLGILQSLAKQKSIIIENRIEKELELRQYYEPLKILIYNLLTNAINFSEKGTIAVAAINTNNHITISVKDEGSGMTPEQIQRLMEDQVVITSANVDHKRGHGLGYLIIKDLLKTMGATLHIESEKGEGTTVSISMSV